MTPSQRRTLRLHRAALRAWAARQGYGFDARPEPLRILLLRALMPWSEPGDTFGAAGGINMTHRIIDGKKQCTDCGGWFPTTSDYFYLRTYPGGKRYFEGHCRKCGNVRHRNLPRKRDRAKVNAYNRMYYRRRMAQDINFSAKQSRARRIRRVLRLNGLLETTNS